MNVRVSKGCWPASSGPATRWRFPPLQRAQIIQLACLEPIAKGLHISHWSSEDLALEAVRAGIVASISARTVRRILHEVQLQPHRSRYWKTPRFDTQFKDRAEKVLWCYGNAPRLAEQGIWTVCIDESPNRQVLQRDPIRRAIPGAIERREFEYIRRGTVNLLICLIVHTGQMELLIEPRKDAAHYIDSLKAFRQRHAGLRGVFLIQDNDSTHTARATAQYLAEEPGRWWRPRFTPVHASWLNQAEILIGAFARRYIERHSWNDREAFIDHVTAAVPEYNARYAKPIEWTWTNAKMRRWFDSHGS